MRHRILAAVAALTLLAGGLTACSGESSSAETADFPNVDGKVGEKPEIAKGGKDKPTTVKTRVLSEGSGDEIKATDTVAVDYIGQTWEGDVFDESYSRPTPALFGLNQVIEGWREGLTGTHVGDRVQIVIPPDKGYGDEGVKSGGQSSIPGGATLVFVVDVLGHLDGQDVSQLKNAKPVANPDLPEWLSIEGAPGAKPKVTIAEGASAPDEQKVIVLAEGTGPELTAEDYVAAHVLTIGAGSVEQSTWDQGTPQVSPAPIGNNPIYQGQKVGARIALIASGVGDQAQDDKPNVYIIDIANALAPKRADAK